MQSSFLKCMDSSVVVYHRDFFSRKSGKCIRISRDFTGNREKAGNTTSY